MKAAASQLRVVVVAAGEVKKQTSKERMEVGMRKR